MAKQKSNGSSDPVRLAEEQVTEARARLAGNAKEEAERTQAVARLDEAMGANPDAKDAERMGAQARVHEARLRHLARERKTVEEAVRTAEAALTKARADRAQDQVNEWQRHLDEVNVKIADAFHHLGGLVQEHKAILGRCDLLAHQHALPTPPRRRWFAPKELIRSDAGEALRNALKREHALGGIQQQPADGGGFLMANVVPG